MYSDRDDLAAGFPHSDIRGSKLTRSSPRLFAACHVLRRLLAPRHPPIALSSLITKLPTVVLTNNGRTQRIIVANYLVITLCVVFKEHTGLASSKSNGGPDWVRTSDPTLIKRVL